MLIFPQDNPSSPRELTNMTDALFPLPPRLMHSGTLAKVRSAVRAATKAGQLGPGDSAMVALAERTAYDLDACPIGSKEAAAFQAQLAGALKELGLTPRARRLNQGDDPAAGGQGVHPLDEISRIRMARKSASSDAG